MPSVADSAQVPEVAPEQTFGRHVVRDRIDVVVAVLETDGCRSFATWQAEQVTGKDQVEEPFEEVDRYGDQATEPGDEREASQRVGDLWSGDCEGSEAIDGGYQDGVEQ